MSLIYKSLLSFFPTFSFLFFLSLFSSSSWGFWEEGRWPGRGHLTFELETRGLKWIHTILADGPVACAYWPRRMEGWENTVKEGNEVGWCGGAVSLPGWQLRGCRRRSPLPPVPRGLPLDLIFGGDLVVPESRLSPVLWVSWLKNSVVGEKAVAEVDRHVDPVLISGMDDLRITHICPFSSPPTPFISYYGVLGAALAQKSHQSLCRVSALRLPGLFRLPDPNFIT